MTRTFPTPTQDSQDMQADKFDLNKEVNAELLVRFTRKEMVRQDLLMAKQGFERPIHRCGEDCNGFYDRLGDYFRVGVDPRNSFGRLANGLGWKHAHACRANDVVEGNCNCGELRAAC